MEIIGELLLALFEFIAELVLQIVFEAVAELGLHTLRQPFRRLNPWLAGFGYVILGAIAGAVSLWLFPALFIKKPWLRVLNLVATPLAAGALMAALGEWRRRRNEVLILLDRFSYGFLFAFSMALVRFIWGK